MNNGRKTKEKKSIFMVLLVSFSWREAPEEPIETSIRFGWQIYWLGAFTNKQQQKKTVKKTKQAKKIVKSYAKLIDEYGDEDETPTHGVKAKT